MRDANSARSEGLSIEMVAHEVANNKLSFAKCCIALIGFGSQAENFIGHKYLNC